MESFQNAHEREMKDVYVGAKQFKIHIYEKFIENVYYGIIMCGFQMLLQQVILIFQLYLFHKLWNPFVIISAMLHILFNFSNTLMS